MKWLDAPACIILFTAMCISLCAQPAIKFHSITTKDGLAGDIVYALHQDKQGFLWIGTHRGLNRYDGYSFKLYAYDPSDTNSISGNHIHCIKEDVEGVLWLATNKGLNSLNPTTGKIKHYPQPAGMPDYMLDILPVNDSVMLINARTTLYRFNKKTSLFTPLKIISDKQAAFRTDTHAKFTRDGKGNIYIAGVVINWQLATATYINTKQVLKISYSAEAVNQLYFDVYNNAWCFAMGAPLLTEEVNGKDIPFPYKSADVYSPENNFNAFYEETGKHLWMATGHGLLLYDYLKHQFYRYLQKAGDNSSISNNRVQTIIKDRKGIYWVGTFGSGICYFTLQPKFKSIIIDSIYTADEQKVRGMSLLQSGRIYVNTLSGKKFLVEKDKTIHAETMADFEKYHLLDSLVYEFTGKPLSSFSPGNSALLHSYFNARCEVGCLPDKKKHYALFKSTNDIFRSGELYMTDNNSVWIKYSSHLYDGTSHTFNALKQEPVFLWPMPDENFLIASTNGLHIYDTRSNSISATYMHEAGNPYSISSNNLQYLLPADKGNYWIATADAGFDYWDRKTDRFHNYSTKDGLPDNTVYMILPDAHGRLWISTNKGLSCFDTESRTFTNYDKYDGLLNSEFNWGSACTDKEGMMYFGGMEGIDYFHPDSVMQTVLPPTLIASAFSVHNRFQPLNTSYKLGTDDNTISIEFTGNDFLNAAKTFYRYKLDEADEDWVAVQGINKVSYNKLPHGKYHFTVQASYDNKSWGIPLQLSFSIATPWFQSWWFFMLVVLFIVGSLYLAFNYRLQQQLKILKIRNQIHRDLHDDVGATLSSVKAYSEILSNNPGNPVIAGLIKENAEEMIEKLEVIAWAASPQHDSFGSLVDKVNRYALPSCSANSIRFEAVQNGVDRNMVVPGEIRQTLYLVAKEAINNANKYSAAANCKLTAEIHNNLFTLAITDDGKGFNGTVNGSGNGIRNIQERIKEAGGKANIISTPGKGTIVSISLPYPFKIPHIRDRKKTRH